MNKKEIKELARQEFINNVMSNLDSSLIFTYIQKLEQENKEQEEYIKYWQNEYDKKMEIIDKAIEYIILCIIDSEKYKEHPINKNDLQQLYKILKGDNND